MARDRIYVDDGVPKMFAQRLNKQLLARGWRPADLVRKIQPLLPEGVKFGRHLPSSWLKAKHMPSPLNLDLVARALGVPLSELMPADEVTLVQSGVKPVQMTMTSNGMARVKLDMELPTEIALQVMALVNTANKEVTK